MNRESTSSGRVRDWSPCPYAPPYRFRYYQPWRQRCGPHLGPAAEDVAVEAGGILFRRKFGRDVRATDYREMRFDMIETRPLGVNRLW